MSVTAIVIIAAVALLLIIFVSIYNSLVKLKNKVEEAFAIIDTELKRRYDLIPNLVETVKGYAKHEKETLESVMAARNKGMAATTVEEKDDACRETTRALGRLMALRETYPDLKANQNFMSLQNELTKTENSLMQSRKYYNAVVRDMNTKTQVFPQNIVASMFGFKQMPYLQTDEEERKNVKVQF